MKIKELSNLLNVSQKTIRYYEGCGFIMPLTQNKSGRIFRDYDEAAITQLKTIIGLRKLRFSIDEIKDLFAEPEKLAEICNTHRNNLEREIGVMTQICKLLDDVDYSHINEAKDLTEQVEMLRRETKLHDYLTSALLMNLLPIMIYANKKLMNTRNIQNWLHPAIISHIQK